jgi:hypothetical protein
MVLYFKAKLAINFWRTHAHSIALLVILGLGALLRYYGLDWGLPYRFHVDEHQYVIDSTIRYWRAIVFTGDFNPHLSTYGTVPMYALILVRLIVLLPLALAQNIPLSWEYLTADHARITYLVGRAISATFSTATIYVFYLIGCALFSKRVGLLTAGLVALLVAIIQAAHYYTVDTMLIFFMALTLLQSIRIVQEGHSKYYVYAGICMALALATKLPVALSMALPLGMAHLFNQRALVWQGRLERGLINRCFDSRCIILIVVTLGLFLLISPFSLLDFEGLYLSRRTELNAVRNVTFAFFQPHATWTLAYYGLTPIVYELTTLLFFGMGIAIETVSLFGVFVALRSIDRSKILLLIWVLSFFLLISMNRIKTIRYILPLIPFLAVYGAFGLHKIIDGLSARRLGWLATTVFSLVVGFSLFYAIAFTRLYGERDSRLLASDWLYEHAPAGSVIVVEDEFTYMPPLGVPNSQLDRWNHDIAEPGYAPKQIHHVRVLFSPYYSQYEIADNSHRARQIRDTITGADYIVVSERHYHPYSRLPDYRPVEYQYYQDLFSGRLGYRLATVFDPSPHLLGITLNDDRAELFSKVFDNPKIWIFVRSE